MSTKSPHNTVKERFGDKSKLIDALVALIEAGEGESADGHKRRLRNVSNAKLLHLHALGQRVKELGGRDAIVKAILELKNQPKDHEYADHLRSLALGRIVDLHTSLSRAAKKAAAKTPKAAPKAAKPKAAKPAAKTAAKPAR